VLYSDGRPSGVSTIVVTRHNGTIRIAERTTLQGDVIDTTRTIDPSSFTTLDYAIGDHGWHAGIVISGETATYRGGAKATTLAAATTGPSIVFDFLVGEYVAIPAMIQAATTAAFNVYCVCFSGFEVKTSQITPAITQRPAGIPGTDAAAAFVLDDGTATLWYDPVSFVLRELDVPKARIRIVLI